MRWAQLLKRVFDLDIEHCPHCGGQLKLIAAIEEPAVIQRILTHLGTHRAAATTRTGRAGGSVAGGLTRKYRMALDRAEEGVRPALVRMRGWVEIRRVAPEYCLRC